MNNMEWKKEFLKLFTTDSIEDYRKALKLKRDNLPEKLYRYRPLSDDTINTYRLREIVDGELYLSHPNELNDPFEASSILHSTDASHYSAKREQYKQVFHEIIPERQFVDIFESDDWFDKLTTYVAEKTVSTEKIKETKKALEKTVLHTSEEINSHLTQTSRRMVRIACFTSKGNNLPMWNHYTLGHTGMCLEYRTADIQNIYQKNRLFPVMYVNKLPDVTHMMLNRVYPKFSLFDYIAMHKLSDWSYEDEWRLIYDPNSWYLGPEGIPKEYWDRGKTTSFIRPSRIILGMKISSQHEKRIREIAQSVNIPVIKAAITEYGLKIE